MRIKELPLSKGRLIDRETGGDNHCPPNRWIERRQDATPELLPRQMPKSPKLGFLYPADQVLGIDAKKSGARFLQKPSLMQTGELTCVPRS